MPGHDSTTIVVVSESGDAITTSLAIAQGIERDHASVIKLVREKAAELEAFGLLDFKSESSAGRPTEYAILNERQATLLMTFFRSSAIVDRFKIRLVGQFYEMARQLNDPAAIMARALKIADSQLALASERVQALEHKVAEDAPKVEFTERVQAAEGSASMSAVAKTFKTGPIRLYAKLRELKIIKPGTTEPYQQYIDRGWFELEVIIIDKGYRREAKHVTRVTNKGQFAIQQLIDGRSLLN